MRSCSSNDQLNFVNRVVTVEVEGGSKLGLTCEGFAINDLHQQSYHLAPEELAVALYCVTNLQELGHK